MMKLQEPANGDGAFPENNLLKDKDQSELPQANLKK